MDSVIWEGRPQLQHPVALIAFEGWGDAGSSSSMAVDHILGVLETERFAVIDSDEFFDFQVRRPVIELDDDGARGLLWPDTEFHAVSLPGANRDLVLVIGHEPHARWKAFARAVVEVLQAVGVRNVVSMGAFMGQVPHTLPVPLVGVTTDPALLTEHHLFASGYEGPTGIVGVLNQALVGAGFETVSLWAAVPHYLTNQDYPPGGLALLDKAMEILGISLDTGELTAAAAEFRRQVDDALEDSDLRSYVEELEDQTMGDDVGIDDPGAQLVQEIERFLKDS